MIAGAAYIAYIKVYTIYNNGTAYVLHYHNVVPQRTLYYLSLHTAHNLSSSVFSTMAICHTLLQHHYLVLHTYHYTLPQRSSTTLLCTTYHYVLHLQLHILAIRPLTTYQHISSFVHVAYTNLRF